MKKNKFYFAIFFWFFFINNELSAQIITDISGAPLKKNSYTDVLGSPYLLDTWSKGLVKLENGQTFKDIELKYNELDDVALFHYKGSEELNFVDQVKEFKLNYIDDNKIHERTFRNGYTGVPGFSGISFFEVLSDGSAQLIKKVSKTIVEEKPFNSATTTRSFQENTKYFLIINGNTISFKKDKKFILANLTTKQGEVGAFIKANNINVKDDADLTKLFNYYNSI